MIPEYGDLANLAGKQLVVGVKQLKKALRDGRAKFVLLAENADPALTAPIAELCKSAHVSCAWVSTMQALGSACGIEVGAAAAAVLE